ncbi:MAG TPA: methyltransferase domain-containing protein [Vicinamibacterales bacterium]|nr:methyltransferase domain-containing protein [Vicinamibacterales bacterium]
MSRDLDALTSSTLKHLREQWWNDAFTSFLVNTLQPRAGMRILDVGCGTGLAEVSLSRHRLPQVDLVGVDLVVGRVHEANEAARGANLRAGFAAADACHLPFGEAVFDSTYCVAVLQHIKEIPRAVAELARVTRPGGRVVAVEPDNAARYWFSSLESGTEAFERGRRFFTGLASARGESPASPVGPLVPGIFAAHGIEPVSVQLFPVSVSHLGTPSPALWESRRTAVREAIDRAPDGALRRLGTDYLKAIDQYAEEASRAGTTFVEIQNTMLFATVGQRPES